MRRYAAEVFSLSQQDHGIVGIAEAGRRSAMLSSTGWTLVRELLITRSTSEESLFAVPATRGQVRCALPQFH